MTTYRKLTLVVLLALGTLVAATTRPAFADDECNSDDDCPNGYHCEFHLSQYGGNQCESLADYCPGGYGSCWEVESNSYTLCYNYCYGQGYQSGAPISLWCQEFPNNCPYYELECLCHE
jgi:hypothetical protein